LSEFVCAACSRLSEVAFPPSLEVIDGGSFSGCSGLTGSIFIPESVKYAIVHNGELSIDKYAFSASLRCVIATLEAKDALENGDLTATQYCCQQI
jgi:hypothetical protein